MSIATKTGDKGETSLLGGERIRKTDMRIAAYGTVDELNASLGVALCHVRATTITTTLEQVQHHLFTIGAELAAITNKELTMDIPRISSKHLTFIEQKLEQVEQTLPQQKEFILPKGTLAAAHLHLARTICRRAERITAKCNEKHPVNPEVLRYLNRLGDLLFLYARKENLGTVQEEGVKYD